MHLGRWLSAVACAVSLALASTTASAHEESKPWQPKRTKSFTLVHSRVLGHMIEIVLVDDPARLDPGDHERTRLLFQGKPLVATREARTNAKGEVAFDATAGTWLLRTVHMRPCAGCSYAEWESFWTSFTFAID